jgi:hypothetical protein
MAVSRISKQSIQQAFPKGNTVWDGTSTTSAFDSLGVVVLSAASANVTFSNIPQTYTHLQLRVFAASTTTGSSVNDMFYQFNADTASNYSTHYVNGNGASTGNSGATASTTKIRSSNCLPYAGYTLNFGTAVVDILDYTSTVKSKTVRSLSGSDFNGSGYINMDSGAWYKNTTSVYESISSIVITSGANNLAIYSSFALYGIK